jgi:hypothetical protein
MAVEEPGEYLGPTLKMFQRQEADFTGRKRKRTTKKMEEKPSRDIICRLMEEPQPTGEGSRPESTGIIQCPHAGGPKWVYIRAAPWGANLAKDGGAN